MCSLHVNSTSRDMLLRSSSSSDVQPVTKGHTCLETTIDQEVAASFEKCAIDMTLKVNKGRSAAYLWGGLRESVRTAAT